MAIPLRGERVKRIRLVLSAALAITCVCWVHYRPIEQDVLYRVRSGKDTVLTSDAFEKLRQTEQLFYSNALNVFESGCLSRIDPDGLQHLKHFEELTSEVEPDGGVTNQTETSFPGKTTEDYDFEAALSRPEDLDKPPNVVIFVLDSLSRADIHKYLPVTTRYF